jgi:hypothetical protein
MRGERETEIERERGLHEEQSISQRPAHLTPGPCDVLQGQGQRPLI